MPFTCDYPGCGRIFKTQAVLDSHKKSHAQTQETPTPTASSSTVPQIKSTQPVDEFLKHGIDAKQDEKTLIFEALEKYPTETFSSVQLKIMNIHQAIKQAEEEAKKAAQVEAQKSIAQAKAQSSTVIKKSKHAFTRFKDYNIMLVFGTQEEKYYTDVPPEILDEMHKAAMDAIINVIRAHTEINLIIEG